MANSEKLITEEVGKGDGGVETDTSDTLTPGEGGSCGAGGDFGGGRERLSATTFAAPGIWRRSIYMRYRIIGVADGRTTAEKHLKELIPGEDDQSVYEIFVLLTQSGNG